MPGGNNGEATQSTGGAKPARRSARSQGLCGNDKPEPSEKPRP